MKGASMGKPTGDMKPHALRLIFAQNCWIEISMHVRASHSGETFTRDYFCLGRLEKYFCMPTLSLMPQNGDLGKSGINIFIAGKKLTLPTFDHHDLNGNRGFAFVFHKQLSLVILRLISCKNLINSNFQKLPLSSHLSESSWKPCFMSQMGLPRFVFV